MGRQHFVIVYVDVQSRRTEREILPQRILGTLLGGRGHAERIEAICLLKKAVRTFRLDRIETFADAETGELVPMEAWITDAYNAATGVTPKRKRRR